MNASDFTTLYHVNPVVSELNSVKGFDPLQYVRNTKTGLTLDLPYKKLWFRLKYPNGIVRPFLVKLTDQLAIIEARVFLDRRDADPVASYIAECEKNETDRDYIKKAQNTAIDRALSDAGFGVQFIPCKPQTAETSEDADVPTKAVPAPAEPKAEATASEEQNTAEQVEQQKAEALPEPTAEAETPAYSEDMTVDEICSVMTTEQAKEYVVKDGACSGWTIAQVADRRPASLKFYVQGYQGKDNILRAAAKIMLQNAA